MNQVNELLTLLESEPNSPSVPTLISDIEANTSVDLQEDSHLLTGVWELRWSSSSQPWLKRAPWLENLQVLDVGSAKGCNLLRLKGFFGSFASITVQAELDVRDNTTIGVLFKRGGWLGPSINGWTPKLLASINQSYPAWLQITFINETLRLCRGNAGTLFALTRRTDLEVSAWIR